MNMKKRLVGSDPDLFSAGARTNSGIFSVFYGYSWNHRRRRGISVYVLSFIFLVVFYPACLFRSEKTSYKIEFCRFELDEIYKQANASFMVLAYFDLDPKGNPMNIYVPKLGANLFIEPSKIIDCIKKWKISGVRKGCRVVALWQWRHGIGWLPLTVMSRGFMLEIETTGGRN